MNVSDIKLHEAIEGAEYHAVSPLAVGSLVLGLLSPVALIAALLWIVPALAIGLACLAFRGFANSDGALTGRGTAFAGLALGLIFAAAGPVHSATTRYLLAEQARPICEAWFDFLRQGEPHKAHQLMQSALHRRALNDHLWGYYRDNPENREALEQFVATPVPRAVLEYGPKCQIRFIGTTSVATSSDSAVVELTYAVTYPAEAGKKTFFVTLIVERRAMQNGDIAWRILRDKAEGIPIGLE